MNEQVLFKIDSLKNLFPTLYTPSKQGHSRRLVVAGDNTVSYSEAKQIGSHNGWQSLLCVLTT